MTGIVISGGTFSGKEQLKEYIDKSIVVCADSGYIYASELGIVPNAVIGDFDSMPLDDKFKKDGVEIIRHKVEKDESDTQLCVDYLISRGVTDIYIFAALGGERFEHTYANLKLLEYGADKGVRIIIKNENTEIFLVSEETAEIFGKTGDYISVFTTHGASGICYTGLKYNLEQGSLASRDIIGLSNAMTDTVATVSVEKGQLIIIHTGKCLN